MIYKNNEQIINELKKLFIDVSIPHKNVASRLGIKPQGLQKLFNKKNLGFEDINKILSAIGYHLEIEFKENSADNNV